MFSSGGGERLIIFCASPLHENTRALHTSAGAHSHDAFRHATLGVLRADGSVRVEVWRGFLFFFFLISFFSTVLPKCAETRLPCRLPWTSARASCRLLQMFVSWHERRCVSLEMRPVASQVTHVTLSFLTVEIHGSGLGPED